jgi:hypothetical protein
MLHIHYTLASIKKNMDVNHVMIPNQFEKELNNIVMRVLEA